MTKFAAIVRRIVLSIFMVLFLIACITKAESNTQLGAILYIGMLVSIGIYILFSVISVIVRSIKRKQMDEHSAIVSAYTDTILFMGNSNVISYFRRIAFWGTIMLVVNIVALHVPRYLIVGGPYATDVVLKCYHGFLLWSLLSLVLLFIISLLFFAFYLPHYGTGANNVFQYVGKLFVADLLTPYRVIKNFFTKSEGKKRFIKIFHLLTLIAFVAFNIVAIIKSI